MCRKLTCVLFFSFVLVAGLPVHAGELQLQMEQVELEPAFFTDEWVNLGTKEGLIACATRLEEAVPSQKLICTAEAECYGGCTVSCTGCPSDAEDESGPGTGWVKCGGVTNYCPYQCPDVRCPDTPWCSYVFHYGDGCCKDSQGVCPDICE